MSDPLPSDRDVVQNVVDCLTWDQAAALIAAHREAAVKEDRERAAMLIEKLYQVRNEPDKMNSIIMHERAAIMQGDEK
jgi:hypothetical protein